MSSSFVCNGMVFFSFCKPSLGPTSTMRTFLSCRRTLVEKGLLRHWNLGLLMHLLNGLVVLAMVSDIQMSGSLRGRERVRRVGRDCGEHCGELFHRGTHLSPLMPAPGLGIKKGKTAASFIYLTCDLYRPTLPRRLKLIRLPMPIPTRAVEGSSSDNC